MIQLKILGFLIVVFTVLLAGDGKAQRLSVAIGKNTKHGAVALQFDTGWNSGGFASGGYASGGCASGGYASGGFASGGYAPSGYAHQRRYSAPRQVWLPGRYETVCQKVWVEGSWREEWVDPVYDYREVSYGSGCSRVVRVCVTPGYWHRVKRPGCWEQRSVQVWVAGHWQLA